MPERKLSYEPLEHKSDTGFKVKAPSLQRLYVDNALALTDMMVKLGTIQEKDKRSVDAAGENREALMVTWLNEILFLFERHKFLSKRIVFNKFDGKTIQATVYGETYEPVRHGSVSEIKAVTYHQLELKELNDPKDPENLFFSRVFLDL
jgi:SHS2 domain-containing protein